MKKAIFKRVMAFLLVALMLAPSFTPFDFSIFDFKLPVFAAATGTHTPVTGITVGVSGATDNSMSNGTVTVTAKGSGGFFGIGASSKTATITVTNSGGSSATISFDWTASSVNQLTIDGSVTANTSGRFSKVLDANGSITITIVTAENSTTNTLKMSNFAYEEAAASSNITFEYDSSLGSITVGGSAMANGGVASNVTVDSGVAVAATPISNACFVGWLNTSSNELISDEKSFTLKPASDMTVKAVFTQSTKNAWFIVGDKLFNDLNTANNAAASGSTNTIVVAADGTLPAGNYTISSGVTLLVPFDAAGTGYTTQPGTVSGTYTTPSVFRTLTMASGANITVNGAICVSGQQFAGGSPAGGPNGPLGFINMQSNSNIVLNSGANLYCWGYITGSGAVLAKSGSVVYEDFQAMDWRGGNCTSEMIDNQYKVFPMSQYYIQNIEVPITFEAGAEERGFTSVAISLIGIQGAPIPFICSDGMFNIISGSITKDYDEGSDRLNIAVNGEVKMQSLTISMNLGALIGNKTMNSANYVLPINGNISVTVKNGGTINVTQHFSLLPGAEIIIDAGGTCNFIDGKAVYIYDYNQWPVTDGSGYVSQYNYAMIPVAYAPGRKYNRTKADLKDAKILVNGTVNATNAYVFSTWCNSENGACTHSDPCGANIVSDGGGKVTFLSGDPTSADYKLYQMLQTDNKPGSYPNIPITSAVLKNADGSFVYTSKAGGANRVTLNYVDGKWICETHTETSEVTTDPGCTTPGVTTHTCSVCGNVRTTNEPEATGHVTLTPTAAKESTCTQQGNIAYWTCSCGKIFTDEGATQETTLDAVKLPLKDHTPGADATCNSAQTCTVCSKVLVDALGHQRPDPTKPCIDQTCSRCGTKITPDAHTIDTTKPCLKQICSVCESEVLPTVEHTIDANKACSNQICSVCSTEVMGNGQHTYNNNLPGELITAASCVKKAVYYVKCDNCTHVDKTKTVEVGELAAHTPAEAVEENRVESTCYSEGSYDSVVYCSVCKTHEFSRDKHTIEKKAHTPAAAVEENRVESTCYSEGSYDTVVYCSVAECHAEISRETHTIEKKAHTPDEAVKENVVAATCYAEGSYDSVVYCSVCKTHEISRDKHTIEKEAHTPDEAVEENRVEATCTKEGSYEEVVYCSVAECHAEISRTPKTIAKAEHTPGEAKRENVVEASCTVAGSYDEVVYCSVCETYEISRTSKTGEKLSHTEEIVPGYAATCTETGLTDGTRCSVCGTITDAQEVIPKVAHTEEEILAVSPTCTATGLTAGVKCSVCDEILTPQTTVDALGHAMTLTPAEESTCEVQGNNAYYTCSVCDIVSTDEAGEHETTAEAQKLPLADHTEEIVPGKAATCTETGLTDGEKCSVCGKTLVEQEEISALRHSMIHYASTGATCTEAGNNAYWYCNTCKKYFSDDQGNTEIAKDSWVISASGHSLTHTDAKDATCTEAGNVEYWYCNACDSYFSDIDAENKINNVTINALGHNTTKTPAKAATCGVEGNNEYWTCSKCDGVFKDENGVTATTVAAETLDALNHIPGDPATCTTAQICTRDGCGATLEEALGHQLVKTDAKAATCYAEGNNEYWTCMRDGCGGVFSDADGKNPTTVDAQKISKTEHTPGTAVKENEVAHTCTTAGSYDLVVRCTVAECNAVISSTHEVDPAAHTLTKTDAVASTCDTKGNIAYWTCSVCHKYFSDAEGDHEIDEDSWVLDLRAHQYGDAVYTGDGKTSYTATKKCTYNKCDHKITEDAVITSEVITEETCTSVGTRRYTATFNGENGFVGKTTDETIAKLGHAWTTEYTFSNLNTEAASNNITVTRHCSRCEADDSVTGTATINVSASQAATCLATGKNVYDVTATFADDVVATGTYEKATDKLAHSTNRTPAKEATCTETGNNDYWYCSGCEKYYSNAECTAEYAANEWIIPVKSHSLTPTAAKSATCTEAGNSAYWTCGTCGQYFGDENGNGTVAKDSWVIPAHGLTHTTANEATCTATGNTEYWTCNTCTKYYSDAAATAEIAENSWVTSAKGHDWGNYTQSNHNTTALTVDVTRTCQRNGCGESETKAGTLAKDSTKSTAATCLDSGEDYYNVAATFDGYAYTGEYRVSVGALDHDYVDHAAQAPTCEGIGWDAYQTCSRCDYTTYVEKEALKHAYDETKSESNLTRPVLVGSEWVAGYYTHVCANDPAHTTTEPVARADYHSYEAALANLNTILSADITDEARTAINAAITANAIAQNLIVTEQATVDAATAALNSTFDTYKGALNTYTVTFKSEGNVISTITVVSGQNATAPANPTKASDATYHYTFTGWDVAFTNVTSDLTVNAQFSEEVHNYTVHTPKDDTYHTDKCACGYEKDAEHSYNSGEQTTDPTCTATGVRTYTCSVCTGTKTETIDALKHDYAYQSTVDYTCTENGYDIYKCSRCDSTEKRNETSAAHRWDENFTVDVKASCFAAGSKSIHCSACSATKDVTVIEQRSHNVIDVGEKTAPTCKTLGVMNQKCNHTSDDEHEACNYTTTREISLDPTNHEGTATVTKNYKAATCEEDGYTGDKHWSCCDALAEAGTAIGKLNHSWQTPTFSWSGDYLTCTATKICSNDGNHKVVESKPAQKVTNPATCATEGSIVYTVVFSEAFDSVTKTYTEKLSKLSHSYTPVVTAPTCTEQGYTTYTCQQPNGAGGICGDSYVTDYQNALGHDYTVFVNTVAPTCTAQGYTVYKCSRCDSKANKDFTNPAHTPENAPTVVKKATCLADGYKVVLCAVCDAEIGSRETIAKRTHDIQDTTVATAATCTSTGVMNQACAHVATDEYEACGYTTTRVIPVDATAHTGEANVIKNQKTATCEQEGYTGDIYWSCCDKLASSGNAIAKTSHNIQTIPAVAATCTTPGSTAGSYCTECRKTILQSQPIDALGHLNDVALGGYDATCENTGLTDGVKCSRCQTVTTHQTIIPAKGHKYTNYISDGNATCTADGTKTASCENGCGQKDTVKDVGTALGHDESGANATCDTPKLCKRCNAQLAAALGHDWKITYKWSTDHTTCTATATCKNDPTHKDTETGDADVNTTPATCTVPGSTVYTVVFDDVRFDEQTYTVTIPAGHTKAPAVQENVVPATCTGAGHYDSVVYCSVCGDELSRSKNIPIPATGHTKGEPIEENRVAAGCIKDGGYDTVVYCTVCDQKLSSTHTVLTHTGHSYDMGRVTQDPTCTVPGVKTFTCENDNTHTYTESIPTVAHTPGNAVEENKVEATCTVAGGYDEVVYCSVCRTHEISRVHKVIDALGHTPGTAVTENNVAPDCVNGGSYDTVVYCTVCDAELSRTTTPVDPLGHTYDAGVVTAPTCTEEGYTLKTCSVCDENTVGHTVKVNIQDALGHTPGTPVIENKVGATCTVNGSYDEVVYCTVETCGAEISREHKVETAPGHTEEIDAAVPATCTEKGKTEGKHCSVCNVVLVSQNDVDALGHTPEKDERVEPTCTGTGLAEGYHCSVCDAVLTAQQEIPALGHLPGKAATCTTDQVCTRDNCGAVITEKLGHDYKAVVTDPTCTTGGYTTHTCSRCSDSYKDAELPELGHDYKAVVTDPTCTTGGYTTHTCSRCSDSYKDTETVKLGHNMTKTEANPSTCSVAGNNEYYTCDRCSKVFKDAEGATETTVKAETLALAPHTIVTDPAVDATCDTVGYTAGSHCDVCKTVIIAQNEIPVLGHDLEHFEAKKATYTEIGWEAYDKCTRCKYTTYVEIPMLETPTIKDYDTFIENLLILEKLAFQYAKEVPGKDPLMLVIKYIRTGVDRYNSGSWGIMAGYEDKGFAEYVSKIEDEYNSKEGVTELLQVTSLKNLANFKLPNGQTADIGHMFGTMDITYHNNYGVNHADVAGWAGDIVDLVSVSDQFGVDSTELEALVKEIREEYLLRASYPEETKEGSFSRTDMYGDIDGLYMTNSLQKMDYKEGDLVKLMNSYFTTELNDVDRAKYFIEARMDGITLRSALREAVYNAYTGNKVIATLEGTREFETNDLDTLRKACCYAFADYICELAGDYVDVVEKSYFTVFSSESSVLAPGITQEIKYAKTADGKQIAYYIATGDVTRPDVNIYANYKDNDPSLGWGMQRVLDQANAAQNKYGNPESEHYIENYNVIAAINGAGYNMQTGEPSGLLMMGGVEYHPCDAQGFFGMLKDGTPIIGTYEDYQRLKDQLAEGIAGFGSTLVKDGKISITGSSDYYTQRASRTAIGITKTGKVVFMVLDGRQEPVSCGGSMEEIAQIMFEAGCVHAINLDGGGSTTYVAKQEGADALAVVSRPSDGAARSVSTSLIMVSTAPSSTAFDHASVEASSDYLTVGTSIQMTASGVSATGNAAELPEGTTWAVSDDSIATITAEGVLTAKALGDVDVYIMLGEEILGSTTVHVVVPDSIYFPKTNIDAVYGSKAELPILALYDNKPVAINEGDIKFSLSNNAAGTFEGFYFIGDEASGIKKVTVTATLVANEEKTASITVSIYKQGEASFDFDKATGGDRQFAWYREVTNATTEDFRIYEVIDPAQKMVTSYTFAIDMTHIPMPEQLEELTYMLPGADLEGANAWTFLCQLAERISVLTEIKAVVKLDANVDVDYSNVALVNEYFELKSTELDETTNTLTFTLKWIDQTQAIDHTMANPLCMLSGIKLTPKDGAAWNAKDQLTLVHGGEISYAVYLRASALYSFSQKPENQEKFGLLPFVNPDLPSEKGGYFQDVYGVFEDTYTLVKALRNGWIVEDGGYAYYVDGERLIGIVKVEGFYYDFGTEGINVGKTKYTGLLTDASTGKYMYSQFGEIVTGWNMIDDVWYYFDPATGFAYVGTHTLNIDGVNITYEFEETGKVTEDVWYTNAGGSTYLYYGPYFYKRLWKIIDGKKYFFTYTGPAAKGVAPIQDNPHTPEYYYVFDEETCELISICDGFVTHSNGKTYYYPTYGSGAMLYGLNKIEGFYYFFDGSGVLLTGDQVVQSYNSNGILTDPANITFDTEDWYAIDEQGNPITEFNFTYPRFVDINNKTYCYLEPGRLAREFNKVGDYYYYFGGSDGAMVKGDRTVYAYDSGNMLTQPHNFTFDAEHGYAVDDQGNPLTVPHICTKITVVPPTCEDIGYTAHTCIYCDYSYNTDEQETLDHKYDEVVTPPTCTTGGFTTYTCSVCSHSYDDNFVGEEGHKLIGGDTPEWKQDGSKHWHECEKCGVKVDEAEHSFENGSCSTCGRKKYLVGDVDGDGDVDQRDVTRLRRYLAGWDVEIIMEACDADGDKDIDQRDVTRLRRYLAGWDVTLGGNE